MRTAILLSIPHDPNVRDAAQADEQPLPDYLALADRLQATIIAPVRPGRKPVKPLAKAMGFVRVAWAGFRRRRDFDVIISDVDHVGLVLAALLKIARARQRHMVICHGKLPQRADASLIKALRLDSHLHHVVCYGPEAAGMLKHRLPALAERVAVVRHGPDHRFWRPLEAPMERLVVSAGWLRRDYGTLVEAVRGLDVSLEVAAHSPWGTNGAKPQVGSDLPTNVRFHRHDYAGLRRLYDRALVVAVPLFHSHAQSGSLVVYEAMAMGKPVIVTRTDGQASLGLVEDGVTGYYVEPGDVDHWRQLIQHLADHPEEAAEMGRRARQAIEAGINLDAYTAHMAELLTQSIQRKGARTPRY